MCGRFTLRAPASAIAEQFSLFGVEALTPRYNIAPTQPVATVRMAPGEDSRQLAWLRWGLIPSWADDPAIGNRLINARAETTAEKPAFRAALRRRRCLVLADGFYEWAKNSPAAPGSQKRGTASAAKKQPYFIHFRDNRPFGFAGLWESWEGSNHSAIQSCTILTTDANDVVRPIHERMPVIIAPGDQAGWLDTSVQDPKAVVPLLRPYPSAEMEAYRIGPHVNSPTNEDARCIEPIGGQLFS